MMQSSHHSIQSFWKKIEAAGFKFYCVSCSKERRVSPPAKIGSLKFFGHILISTAFATLLTWHWLNWKGFVFFAIPVGLVFETVYRLKMRATLVCPDCSFDPILYLVNRDQAVAQVEQAWRKKFEEKGLPYPEKKAPAPNKIA
jgi:hypothetical protein